MNMETITKGNDFERRNASEMFCLEKERLPAYQWQFIHERGDLASLK